MKILENYMRAKSRGDVNLGKSYVNIWNNILTQDVYEQLQTVKLHFFPTTFIPVLSCLG